MPSLNLRLIWNTRTLACALAAELLVLTLPHAANPQPPAIPRFVVDPFWPKPAPERWVTQEVGATCVDSKDHVVTLNRGTIQPIEIQMGIPASPPVIEYDVQGRVVNAWGDRARLPATLHGCFFDREDNLWIAGNGDGVVQKWAHDGTRMLLQIGTKGVCDGTDGKCASPGLNSSQTLLNMPAAVAVDPANGHVYIADGYGNHRIVVFDRSGRYVRHWGTAGTAPGEFAPSGGGHPHCVVLNQSLLYVCDRANDRVQVFDTTGKLKDVIPISPGTGTPGRGAIGSANDLGFSPDGRYMYVNDIGNTTLWIIDRATRAIVGGFGRPGHGAGELTSFHSMAVDSRGNIYTGEVTGRRIQKFVPAGVVPQGMLRTFLGRPHYDPLP
jgi:outer membrane protein assembly factor BamB